MFDTHAFFGSRDAAAYIAQQCIQMRYGYNNTKIQKLLYCVYGAVLTQFNVRITEEQPRAWPNGPVFPRVFTYIYRGYQIDLYSRRLEEVLSQKEADYLGSVLCFFGKYTGAQLSGWSRKQGSPWQKAVDREGTGWNVVVQDDDIRDYFRENVFATQ